MKKLIAKERRDASRNYRVLSEIGNVNARVLNPWDEEGRSLLRWVLGKAPDIAARWDFKREKGRIVRNCLDGRQYVNVEFWVRRFWICMFLFGRLGS
ncbi:MAG: hypothetical protein ABIH92_01765 [Nanoarchaeota archaeon]